MSFPLYHSLNKDIPKKDLSKVEKEDLIKKIHNIDISGKNLIYALIKFYFIETASDNNESLPYGGIKEQVDESNTNVTWSLLDLPITLRHILYKFVIMHIKKMEEEKHRSHISL